MNWLDIILLIILASSIFASFRKGLTRELIGLVSVIAALLMGAWFYGAAGALFAPYMSSRGLANLAGFLTVFCGVLALGAGINFVLGRFWKATGLSIVDHLLGAAFGAVRGLLISVGLIMGVMAFSGGGHPPDSVVRSRTAPYVAGAARVCAALAPYELKEGFRKTYAEAKAAWAKTVQQEMENAPGAARGNSERKL